MFLSVARTPGGRPGMRAVALTLGCAIVPIALVEREPDLGVVIIMLLLLAGLIALSGLPLRWLAAPAATGALAVGGGAKIHLPPPHHALPPAFFIHPPPAPPGTRDHPPPRKSAPSP